MALRRTVMLCVSIFWLWMLPALGLATPELEQRIRDLITTAPADTVAIYVVDGATSDVLVNLKGEQPVKPASCNKLLTTAAALYLLGEDHRFYTRLRRTGTLKDGVLHGDLIIRGGGDPTISGRFAPDGRKRDVVWMLRLWAEDLLAEFREIDGNIIADDGFFDAEYFHPAWAADERAEWYEAEVSALAFNDNCLDLAWSAKGKMPGDLADVQLNPKTSYVTFENKVRVAAKGRSVERYYFRDSNGNDVSASGTLTVDTTKDDSAAVHNGAVYCATVLRDMLTSTGIKVRGQVVHKRNATPKSGALDISEYPSPELREIIKVINLSSQNFYAECLLKSLGKLKGEAGSFAEGTAVVERFARQHGIYHEGHNAVDGSGLSTRNRTTARQLVETLRFMDSTPLKTAWRESLPQGGTRGSLKSRFQQTSESKELAPRIYGKTGLIGGVRALSGFVHKPDGTERHYSIVLNDIRERQASEALALIDNIAVTIAE